MSMQYIITYHNTFYTWLTLVYPFASCCILSKVRLLCQARTMLCNSTQSHYTSQPRTTPQTTTVVFMFYLYHTTHLIEPY